MATKAQDLDLGKGYRYGWHDDRGSVNVPKRGISRAVVEEISAGKGEPAWMTRKRVKAYEHFMSRPMPAWGADLGEIDFDNIYYYVKPIEEQVKSWDDLPDDIKNTYVKLGIPEAERDFLGGVTTQYESEVVYHSINKNLEEKGVFFSDMDTALREHPDIVKRYFGTIIPANDNKFAALNTAVWSGGCLTEDARVNVADRGSVSIADIEPGDEVFGVDVERNLVRGKVLAQVDSGEKSVYRIRVAGRTLEATGNHQFLVARRVGEGARRRWEAVWAPLDEIEIGEPIAIARELPDDGESYRLPPPEPYRKNHSRATLRFPEETSEDLCWLFGLWLGDGHTAAPDRDMRQISFALPKEDGAYAPALDALREVFGVAHVTEVACGFIVSSMQLGVWIDRLGFHGHAKDKRIPSWIHDLPRDQRLALLGGMIDADGWIENDGKTFAIELSNQELLEDLRQIAIDCGLSADGMLTERTRTATFSDGRTATSTMWRLRITGDLAAVGTRDPKKLGAPVGRWRGNRYVAATGLNFSSLCTQTVGFALLREKEPLGLRRTYDIQVVGLESFVANGIVAHNSFIYVPPGVQVEIPLQAYFRINKENMGQFERTLIIVDEGAYVHYVEGCSAPVYTTDSLHSAVVEIVVNKGARCRYTTIQNWSNNVYNLVTKRAAAYENAVMEWVDGNIGCLAQGSRITTRAGVKPIEDVTPGEEIVSYDETAGELVWRTVLGKRFSGYQPVREVRVGERHLLVTDNHPFFSYTYDDTATKKLGRYALAYVRADHLTEAIVPATSIDYGAPAKVKMPDRLTPYEETTDDLMWLFGLFLGDGSADRARERLTRVMAGVMDSTAPTERRDGVAVTWNSVELADFFEENGFATGASVKRLPGWVLSLPESQRLELIAGYLDSDGCAAAGRRGFSIKSVNRALLADVADIVTSLGITSRIYTEHEEEREVTILGYTSRSNGAHRLDFPCDPRLVAIVSDGLATAAGSQAEAKTTHFRTIGRSSIVLPEAVEIRKVEVGEPGVAVPTWDIEVEGTGNFVSEGFIVHNSKITMKYPSIYLMGEGARGEVLSVAFAGEGQHQDAGGKIIHAAPRTTGQIISKSVSAHGGRTGYRGQVKVERDAEGCKDFVRCDALILDADSRSDTYPYMDIENQTAEIGHEATVSKVGEDQLFYLMSRGITENEAMGMIVNGFIEPITKELPMEYAVELTRLIQLQMEGAVG